MSEQPPCVDFLGTEIKAGDVVVYPGRRGSNMWLVKSGVISVEWANDLSGREYWALRVQHPSGAVRVVKNINRVIVVTSLESE